MTTEELNALIAQAEGGDVAAMNQLGQIYGGNEFKDFEKAFYWHKKAAELGNVNSMSNLGGWCYLQGNGTEKNIPLADEWLKKSVENGWVWTWAFNELANIFANDAQYKDLSKAFYWYSKSAEAGDALGMSNLGGWCYLWGNGTEKNLKLAVDWLEKAAEQNDYWSMERLVYDIYTQDNGVKNYERAYYWFEKIKDSDPFKIYNRRIEWDWLEKAAGDGYIEATYILGNHYQFKDNEKAFEWYKKGAEAGHVLCMKELGGCYEYGRGTDQNKSLAAEWYERAAEKGDTSAMCGLSSLFCLDDKAKSFLWAKKAAEAGNAGGMYYLAQNYFNGSGVEKNIDLAIEWYRKAIKNGDTSGKLLFNDLGMEFQFGNNGREVNLSYAYQFYKLAAECENADGMANAGYCISNGVGVEKDLNKAYEYFKQAADLGHWIGMSNLGWCYLYGNGVEKDIEKAIHWLTRAAEEGNNIWSMNRLTEIYGELDGHVNYEQAAKWFLSLIQKDCDPNSGVYEQTGYKKDLYEKVKNAILSSTSENELSSLSGSSSGGSLFGGAISIASSNAKTYISQAEELITKKNNAEKEKLITSIEKDYSSYIATPDRKLTSTFVIPDGVKRIGDYAFYECYGLESIVIPDSVISIGKQAFWGCKNLKSHIIPDSVTNIGTEAFEGCEGLTSVTLGKNIKEMGSNAFYACKNLSSIYIPEGLKSIGEFGSCYALTSVDLPNSITCINDYAFYNCVGLNSIIIPSSVTTIGHCAFSHCDELTSVTIPDSVTSIDRECFLGCSKLAGIKLGKGVISIGKDAFTKCPIRNIIIPKGTRQRYENMEGLAWLEDRIIEEE